MNNNSSNNNLSTKPRILIVENDSNWIDIHLKNLRDWHYEPYFAEGKEKKLTDDAIEKARKHRCHLAIVDMHLLDDNNQEDISGLNLIHDLLPAKSIVVSSSTHFRPAVNAIKYKEAIEYVGKDEGPNLLKYVLDDAAMKYCYYKRDIIFHYPPDLPTDLLIGNLCQDADARPDEVNEVISRLFPDITELFITQLLKTKDLFSSVPRPHSYILKVASENHSPSIVKLARQEKIQTEIKNYDSYIKEKLPGNFHPSMEHRIVLWDIGGIRYTRLGEGANMETLTEFYPGHTAEEVIKGLRNFFCNSWDIHYKKNNREKQKIPLVAAYQKKWGGKWFQKLFEINITLLGDDSAYDWIKFGGKDPFIWFQEHVNDDPDKDWSVLPNMEQAVTHGDLHGDNIFFDENRNCWVIDYERTGMGPILQDFVELEVDFVTRLIPIKKMDFREFYNLCRVLYKSNKIQLDEDCVFFEPEYLKVYQVIRDLREIAYQQTQVTDSRQYLWGVLLNILFRIVIINDQRSLTQNNMIYRLRAEMYASIICHRLENWDKPWPPYNWPDFNTQNLQKILQSFSIFKSDLNLTNFFIINKPLKIYSRKIPSGSNPNERTVNLIAYLSDKKIDGQESLKIFLKKLYQQYKEEDIYDHLYNFIKDM